MWRFLTVVLALASIAAADTTSSHKVFRLIPESEDQLKTLLELDNDVEGFSYWKSPSRVLNAADLMVAPEKLEEFLQLVTARSIKYKLFIENVEALLESEAPANISRTRAGGFGWTSYHNLEEIYSWFDSLAHRYPDKVQVILAGGSYEGRQIKGVKLSFARGNPGVFIEGGIHAREWISPATVTYLLNQLLTSTDIAVRKIAVAYDWYIFPVVNPDGYEYTHANPTVMQHRLWRKNRSHNHSNSSSSCYGTDLNRNWDYKWMKMGASRDPCSDTYGGRAPFSEPETKSLSAYISSISNRLCSYIAFHSYSQFLIFPYGHTKSHLDNYDQEYALSKKAVKALSKRHGTVYSYGNIAEVIGMSTGVSIDWVKAKFKLPLTFVYELRDKGTHGFILPPNQIIPNGEEVMDSLVALFGKAKESHMCRCC